MHILRLIITLFLLLPSISFPKSDNIKVAVGYYDDGQSHPLLFVNHGTTQWTSILDTNITNVPSVLKPLFSTTGYCSNNICIVGGSGIGEDSTSPYIIVSQDNGYSWHYPKSITGVPSSAFEVGMNATYCLDNHCMATGSYHEIYTCNIPLFLISQDSGQTWDAAKVINSPWTKLDCIEPVFIECGNQFCISGGDFVRDRIPSSQMINLFISNDQGQSWTFFDTKKIKNLPSDLHNSELYAGNCEGNSCTLVGYQTKIGGFLDKIPLMLDTQDGGKTWNYVNPPENLPVNTEVYYDLIDCGVNFCVATGISTDHKTSRPFAVLSLDRRTWKRVNIDMIENPRTHEGDYDFLRFTAIHCDKDVCIIAGNRFIDQYLSELFFLISHDQGQTWRFSNAVTGIPDTNDEIIYGYIFNLNCKEGTCIAAGSYNHGYSSLPLLLSSYDQGISWQYISKIDNLPNIKEGAIYYTSR